MQEDIPTILLRGDRRNKDSITHHILIVDRMNCLVLGVVHYQCAERRRAGEMVFGQGIQVRQELHAQVEYVAESVLNLLPVFMQFAFVVSASATFPAAEGDIPGACEAGEKTTTRRTGRRRKSHAALPASTRARKIPR